MFEHIIMHFGITVMLNNLKFFARRVRREKWSSHAALHFFDSCMFHSFRLLVLLVQKRRVDCSHFLSSLLRLISNRKAHVSEIRQTRSTHRPWLSKNSILCLASYKSHDLGRHHSTFWPIFGISLVKNQHDEYEHNA